LADVSQISKSRMCAKVLISSLLKKEIVKK
jgi:hypothetical protein